MRSVIGKIKIISVVAVCLFIAGCGGRWIPFLPEKAPATVHSEQVPEGPPPEVIMTTRKLPRGSALSTSITHDPLSSWENRQAKARIMAFVEEITTRGSAGYVPESDRIATFDMDGTIYCEKPYWLAMTIALEKLRETAGQYPEVRDVSPYREVLMIDPKDPASTDAGLFPEKHFLLCLTVPFTGWSQKEYRAHVGEFCRRQKDQKFDLYYRDRFYRPMVELIQYLTEKNFRVFIVSGSEQALVRAACNPVLELPPSRYIGTLNALDVEYTEKGVRFLRQGSAVEPSNIGDGKPMNIHNRIGKPPVLAVGNTTGDLGMLFMATTNPKYGNTLGIVIHHNDAKREYQYSDEKLLEKAAEKGWLVVRMKEDFKRVFMKGE